MMIATVIVVFSVLLFALIHNDEPFWATVSLLVAWLFLDYFGVPVWSTIKSQPFSILWALVAYVGAGAAWSVLKWWSFVRAEKGKYDALPDSEKAKVLNRIDKGESFEIYYLGDYIRVRPKPGNHAHRIYAWITFWPWSLAWTIISEPVAKACKAVYEALVGVYERISNSFWD